MKVTVLIENTKRDIPVKRISEEKGEIENSLAGGVETQHGLSLFIETDGKKILLDSGADTLFRENADKLHCDIAGVDLAVLSHGHGDHGGGLTEFFRVNKVSPVYMHKAVNNNFYSQRSDPDPHFIGLDHSIFTTEKDRISFISEDREISENIILFSGFSNDFPRPKSNDALFMEEDGHLVHDRFEHEIALLIKESDGNVLLSSCSHCGICNIIETAVRKFPGRLKGVIGGFHLSGSSRIVKVSERYILDLGDALKKFDTRYFTGHCTGENNFQLLKSREDLDIHALRTGDILLL